MQSANAHVNPHYLNNVLHLSTSATIQAGEDIYSVQGLKLLAKGSRLDFSLQEKLIRHKLAKPLETSIALCGGIDSAWVMTAIENLMHDDSYAAMVGGAYADAIKALFGRLDLRMPGLDLLLALTQRFNASSQQHIVLSALLVVRLGLEEKLPEAELQALALAGLLHQVGHLYLDPALHNKTAKHSLPAWRQLVAQPLIGGMALAHLRGLGKTTIEAVREQHERLDGSGYPVGVQGSMLGLPSQLFGVASLTAGLLLSHGESGLLQAKIAMQLIPGEYSSTITSSVIKLVKASTQATLIVEPDLTVLPALLAHITQLQSTLLELDELFGNTGKEAQLWLGRMKSRLRAIQRTFSTTGLDTLVMTGDSSESNELRMELLLISREIRRRLRDLGKTAVLQVAPLSPQMQDASAPWVESLLNS